MDNSFGGAQKEYIYFPCLRWKKGEYDAVRALKLTTKQKILPIIEVPEMGFDFEKRKIPSTIEEHTKEFLKHLWNTWKHQSFLIDCHLLYGKTVNGINPIKIIFENFLESTPFAIPVIDTKTDRKDFDILYKYTQEYNSDICIRLSLEDISIMNSTPFIQSILDRFSVDEKQCIIIIDIGYHTYEPFDQFIDVLSDQYTKIISGMNFSKIILLGTSFPSSIGRLAYGENTIVRKEWLFFKEILKKLSNSNIKLPNYGDYHINNPRVTEIDFKKVKSSTNIRYTITDNWKIYKGPNARDYGSIYYPSLCKILLQEDFFSGAPFSSADTYIYKCGNKGVNLGNQTKWREIGTNHHIEFVVKELSNSFLTLKFP